MDDAIVRIRRAADAVDPVIRGVDAQQLGNPTPCHGWDLRTLLDHLLGNLHRWAAVIDGREPTQGPTPLQQAGGDVAAAWMPARIALLDAVSADGALDRQVATGQGPSSARMLAGMAPIELMLHGWDAARSTGQSTDLDAGLSEELLGIGRRLMEGRPRGQGAGFGEEQPAPAGATAADRLAAFYGRSA